MHLLRSVVALVTSQQAFVRRTAGGPTTMSAPDNAWWTRGGEKHVRTRLAAVHIISPTTPPRRWCMVYVVHTTMMCAQNQLDVLISITL
jgi:hypothetical protein